MKKEKLYLIISILFVAISIVLTNGFKGTYSAPTGDLSGEGLGTAYNLVEKYTYNGKYIKDENDYSNISILFCGL